jgi:hypothetical protein
MNQEERLSRYQQFKDFQKVGFSFHSLMNQQLQIFFINDDKQS